MATILENFFREYPTQNPPIPPIPNSLVSGETRLVGNIYIKSGNKKTLFRILTDYSTPLKSLLARIADKNPRGPGAIFS